MVIAPAPGAAISEAGMEARSCVLLKNVVGRTAPFQYTLDALTKFVPVIVIVNPGPPAVVCMGFIRVSMGIRLRTSTVVEAVVVPLELRAVTTAVYRPATAYVWN